VDEETGFRESERERCREAMRRLRAKRRKATKEAAEKEAEKETLRPFPMPPVEALLAGLVSQLADTTDPLAVADVMVAYADRGRRLAVPDGNRGSP